MSQILSSSEKETLAKQKGKQSRQRNKREMLLKKRKDRDKVGYGAVGDSTGILWLLLITRKDNKLTASQI